MISALLLLALSAAAAPLPGLYPAEVESARGTVRDVDAVARRITVVDGRGRLVELRVPPELGDLSALPRGSVVEVQYVPAAALELSRSAPVPAADADQDSVTAAVESVDRGSRELVLREDGGAPVRLRVEPGVAGFDEARAGETLSVRYVPALALSLTPKSP
jgi:hypothetical protein